MSDLKLLEDMKIIPEYYRIYIKGQAIRWIIDIRKDTVTKEMLTEDEIVIVTNWIKHFFGITEEDLKEYPHGEGKDENKNREEPKNI